MIELEVIPACREYGLGVVPWSSLAGGLLAGVLEKTNVGRRAHMSEIIENHRPQLEAYETLYHQLGEKPANVALAWQLQNPVLQPPSSAPEQLNR